MDRWLYYEEENEKQSTDNFYIPSNTLEYGRYCFNVSVIVSITENIVLTLLWVGCVKA